MNKEILDFVKKLSLADKKNLPAKCLKVSEEQGELASVVLPYANEHGTRHKFVEKNRILEEVVDTMLASISIAYELEYTNEEIEDMMYRKSLKWAEIQAKEEGVTYPLPYEIHITIKRPEVIDKFINVCDDYTNTYNIKLKPIILDLQNGGESVMTDVMTSSKHMGDNTSAQEDAKRIVDYLSSIGFDVLRTKIETVPWHPAAPRKGYNRRMPKDCYFEAHVGVVVNHDTYTKLRNISTAMGAHLSKNFFKKVDENNYIIMLTYRNYESDYETFKETVNDITDILTVNEFDYEKVITEFSVYDTNIRHDEKWLTI